MREISLHIMDIAENAVSADASLIEITVVEDAGRNRLEIEIRDNGRGIPSDLLERVLDPFYTSRKTRRVGLGLSLFREAARRCEGDLFIRSEEGKGTQVSSFFRLDHIDRAPLGDMAGALAGLIVGNPRVDFVYTHNVDGRVFRVDTRDLRETLDGVPITHPDVLSYLRDYLREGMAELRTRHDSAHCA